jgi:O-succinylbenzoate synthase
MIKFWHHKYELTPAGSLGPKAEATPRQGALLKVQWANDLIGYSDIFPWPEFGDAPIDDQLFALSRAKVSALVEQSIWLAKRDAARRVLKQNAFEGAPKLRNHFLVTDYSKVTDATFKEIKNANFTTLKLKLNKDVEAGAKVALKAIRQHQMMLRLDFNACLDFQMFERFMSFFSKAEVTRIEFIEDPCPWDLSVWKEAAKLAKLALDFEYENVNWSAVDSMPFEFLVLKPARTDVDIAVERARQKNLKIVVSSSMDHPVGVAHAISVAADLKKDAPALLADSMACLTNKIYKMDDFSLRILSQGPFISTVAGSGIGFDDLFAKIEWNELKR